MEDDVSRNTTELVMDFREQLGPNLIDFFNNTYCELKKLRKELDELVQNNNSDVALIQEIHKLLEYDQLRDELGVQKDAVKCIMENSIRLIQSKKVKFDKKRQNAKKNNIMIKGIPENESEDLFQIIIDLAERIDLVLNREEINDCFRIIVKENSPKLNSDESRPIIVKFLRYECKENMMKKRHKLKSQNVIIRDDLTKLRSRIVFELVRCNDVKGVWTNNGNIYYRRKEEGKNVRKRIDQIPGDLYEAGLTICKVYELLVG